MNQITPSKLYELYKEKKLSKSEFMDRILTIYEFSDSEKIRIECLKVIGSVKIKNEKIFKFLEEIVISDSDIEVRINAMSLILKNFLERSYNLVNYLFNSSESKEFILRIAKMIGEIIVSSEISFPDELSNLLKQIIFKIFKNEDTIGFEILWGGWFYKVPEEYWNFLLDLKNPIGLLEIMDYFIDNDKIYTWLIIYLFEKFSLDQWILFFKNSRFSGRFLYILFYLEKETPPARFYQIVEFFEHIGKNLTLSQNHEIIDLTKQNNQYDLALFLIFHWLNYINSDVMIKILNDSELNLLFKIKEVISNEQFGFLKLEYFTYSLLLYLLNISNDLDENYILKFFEMNMLSVRENLLSTLFKTVKSSGKHKDSKIERNYLIKFKVASCEFLKILSKNYEIEILNS